MKKLDTYYNEMLQARCAYIRACDECAERVIQELRSGDRQSILNMELVAATGLLPTQMYYVMRRKRGWHGVKSQKVRRTRYFMEVNADGTPIEGKPIAERKNMLTAWVLDD